MFFKTDQILAGAAGLEPAGFALEANRLPINGRAYN